MGLSKYVVRLQDYLGNAILSHKGAINVHVADVHEDEINDFLHYHDGIQTLLTTAITAGDTSIVVADVTGFVVNNYIHIVDTGIEKIFPKITAIDVPSKTITLDSPISHDYAIAGTSIDHILVNMAIANGSLATPVSYRVQPQAGEDYHILRIVGIAVSITAMDDATFAGITALTNGIVIRKYNGTTGKFRKYAVWHDNSDIAGDLYDLQYADKAKAGEYGLRFRWSFSKLGLAVKLNGDAGDYLEILIQDNLLGAVDLTNLRVKAQGHADV